MSDFKTILFNVLPILINITYSIVLTFFLNSKMTFIKQDISLVKISTLKQYLLMKTRHA